MVNAERGGDGGRVKSNVHMCALDKPPIMDRTAVAKMVNVAEVKLMGTCTH